MSTDVTLCHKRVGHPSSKHWKWLLGMCLLKCFVFGTSSTVHYCSCTGAWELLAHPVGFQICKSHEQPFTELKIIFWDVVSCSLVEAFWHFRGMCCLFLGDGAVRGTYHLTSTKLNNAASQKTVIFTGTAMRNANCTCTVSSKFHYFQIPVFAGLLSHEWENNVKKDTVSALW
jgi:hypothetical protein